MSNFEDLMLATGRWFSPGTPVSSINKTEILLKVALNTINQNNQSKFDHMMSSIKKMMNLVSS